MFFNIAYKNVKKSFKDYSIYFLTLSLAVCIFYSFNSIGSQKIYMEMSASKQSYVEILNDIISYISVFVAFILGSLMLYANNFLIKRRNKEFGIYMTLGMGKVKISKILIFETIIVGIISLLTGLVLGLVASQGLSVLVSKLFNFNMNEYSFIISTSAIIKTIIYFGIMFLLVMVFNIFVISKYKIIDLLTVGRKTQEIKFKNPFVYLVTFILCLISLGSAYIMILKVGLNPGNPMFFVSIVLGIIGTVLFFYSLAGFTLYVVKNNKKVYFKGLNIFVIKQLNSKINTNFISMSIICLMLFLTIGMLSTGFSFKSALEAGLKGSTPFDASAYMYLTEEDNIKSIEESFNKSGFKFNPNDKVAYYNEYMAGTKILDVMPLDNIDRNIDVVYVKISDYNKIRKLQNKENINLSDNEVLITCNFSTILPSVEKYMQNNSTVNIHDKKYNIKNKKVIKENFSTYFVQNNMLTIVINDKFCDNASIISSNVNVNFAQKYKKEAEKDFNEKMDKAYSSNEDIEKFGMVLYSIRDTIYEESNGMTTMILFIGIYLGIVFLISSMAVLALQQLSEASDSIDRYISLKKLGASTKDINKTIFAQTLIFFSMPIGLAIVHSVVGIKVASDFVAMYNKPDIGTASLLTGGIILVVYAIYFYVTYSGYKNIVKNNI